MSHAISKTNASASTPQTSQSLPANNLQWRGRKVVIVVFYMSGAFIVAIVLKKIYHLTVARKLSQTPLATLESEVSKNFSPNFLNQLKLLKHIPYIRAVQKLAALTPDQTVVIKDIFMACHYNDDHLSEILRGAYVCFADTGHFYKNWSILPKVKVRHLSSHPSSGRQYMLVGPGVGEVLFGKTKIKINNQIQKVTFVQLEKYPFTHHLHMLDYLKFKASGKNQGPLGNSIYTHHNPLILS